MKKYFYLTIILHIFLTLNISADDKLNETCAILTLKSIGIDVKYAQIVDGRPKGGEKNIIIGYNISDISPEKQLTELTRVLCTGYLLNKEFNADLDATMVVVGDMSGVAIGTFSVYCSDTKIYMNSKMSEIDTHNYLKKWMAVIINRNYFKVIAALMNW